MIPKAKRKPAEEQGGTGLKILTPKQMLQRLPIALAQVKAGNNLFFLPVKTNHKKVIQLHSRITYKKWILYS